ncbi:hypothetical protein TcasGA2_TC032852 [Tribolium castaneum]|uniref:Uncharacterized protein n=1 Tax=Tribolium castaneum TaxID=7070 RepID=A0A139WJF9_TRICA|nr:hypothetical protein TcasGA2_TC032852 [Tribolium castaneum]
MGEKNETITITDRSVLGAGTKVVVPNGHAGVAVPSSMSSPNPVSSIKTSSSSSANIDGFWDRYHDSLWYPHWERLRNRDGIGLWYRYFNWYLVRNLNRDLDRDWHRSVHSYSIRTWYFHRSWDRNWYLNSSWYFNLIRSWYWHWYGSGDCHWIRLWYRNWYLLTDGADSGAAPKTTTTKTAPMSTPVAKTLNSTLFCLFFISETSRNDEENCL